MNLPKHQILVVDDDLDIQSFLLLTLKPYYRLKAVGDATQAMDELKKNASDYDLILSDIQLPGVDGIQLSEQLKSQGLAIPLIMMTAHASVETAVAAMKTGVFDYILKPLDIDDLRISIDRALRVQSLESENTILRQEVKRTWNLESIVGKSPAIRGVFDLLQRVAPTHANVMITGETGTGKEVFAKALHNMSGRSAQPFVPINCSAIPAELLESELFGHTKGSFTGAHQDKKGLFEEAEGGTVFLDEIGDMEISLQAKLLRVIQERKIKPVGGNKQRTIDVRIISATHKDLKAAMRDGLFREDLFYRLCVIPMHLPALRQRKEDIPLLSDHFFKKHVATHGLKVRGFTPKAMEKLMNHPWEGNVRELENFIERSAILCSEEWISDENLPFMSAIASAGNFLDERFSENLTLREVEHRYINMVLRKTGMRKEQAAQILGIDRKTLYRKEREFGLTTDIESGGGAGASADSGSGPAHEDLMTAH
jgi:two-component system response regulator HydG